MCTVGFKEVPILLFIKTGQIIKGMHLPIGSCLNNVEE